MREYAPPAGAAITVPLGLSGTKAVRLGRVMPVTMRSGQYATLLRSVMVSFAGDCSDPGPTEPGHNSITSRVLSGAENDRQLASKPVANRPVIAIFCICFLQRVNTLPDIGSSARSGGCEGTPLQAV